MSKTYILLALLAASLWHCSFGFGYLDQRGTDVPVVAPFILIGGMLLALFATGLVILIDQTTAGTRPWLGFGASWTLMALGGGMLLPYWLGTHDWDMFGYIAVSFGGAALYTIAFLLLTEPRSASDQT